jgi:hypothetical protein
MMAAFCAGADHGEGRAPHHPLRRVHCDDVAGAAGGAIGPGGGTVLRAHLVQSRRRPTQRDLQQPDAYSYSYFDANIHADAHAVTDALAFCEPFADACADTYG